MEIKSEKMNIKKKIKIMWLIVAVLIFVQFACSVIDYIPYRKAQNFIITSGHLGSSFVNPKESHEYNCKNIYSILTHKYSDVTVYGKTISFQNVRDSQGQMKEAIYNLMKDEGYERFSAYNIEMWFKYTNYFQYFWYYSAHNFFFYFAYGILLIASILTILIYKIRQKELVIAENFLIFKYNKKKSKQVFIKDVVGAESSKDKLRIQGNGFKFNLSLITNAEELKSLIMTKKNELEDSDYKDGGGSKTEADEIKKYKELLDEGIITQEEFDAKKKELLGL